MRRQIAPALFAVAFLRICRSGPAADLITPSTSPQTKSRTIRKMVPVTVPMRTQPTIILGPSTEGFGISAPVRILSLLGLGWNWTQDTFDHVGNAILEYSQRHDKYIKS